MDSKPFGFRINLSGAIYQWPCAAYACCVQTINEATFYSE